MQNRILKIVLDSNNRIVRPLNLKQSYKLETLLLFYEDFKKNYTDSIINTRHKNLSLPKVHRSATFKSGSFSALKFYNTLPIYLKDLSTKNKRMLKKKLKRFL